jgi:hypothetical protein
MSSSSNINVENIISSFPKSPTKIDGKPTYQTLKDLKDTLIENAASIDSACGSGNHGLLGLVVTPAEYIADVDPAHPFVRPVNPGLGPNIPAAATQHQIAQLNHQYTNAKDEYQLINTVEKALRKQITDSVDDLYLSSMHNHLTGYANVPVATMLTNIFTNYAQIDNLAMDDVETNICKQWDPNTPIESMYKQIQTNCDIAEMANQLYSAAQKLSFAYTLVFKTGMFFEACKEWDAKPAADKTWANFKLHFKEEQTRLDRQQRTTQQGGYHSANAALAAQATESVTQIIASGNAERAAKHAALLEISNQQANAATAAGSKYEENMLEMQSMILELQKQVASFAKQKPPAQTRQRRTNELLDPNGYCWTHGDRVSTAHNSATCNFPAKGHQKDATRANTKGGSTKNKPDE